MRTPCALSVGAQAGRTTTSKVEISHRLPREPILWETSQWQLMLLGSYSAVAVVGAVARWPNHRGIALTVAMTPRTFGATKQWRDGEGLGGCGNAGLRPAKVATAP